MIAHYYCELAEISRTKGDVSQLENYANKALQYDVSSVRASILLADQVKASGDDESAIKIYKSIEQQDAESMMLVIDSLQECYENLSSLDRLYEYLLSLQSRQKNLFLQNVIASVLEKSQGKQAAIKYLSDKVKHQPSLLGLQKLVLYKESEIDADKVFSDLTAAISFMQKDSAKYRCQKCGFNTNTHYWLCPGCNNWNSVKPSVIELDH
ncbi:MAG: hypothetical protein ACNYZG_10200, partial [Gammaproteobacteria bacterium]